MKKELCAILTILLLIAGSVANLIHLNQTTEQISNHIRYGNLYCSLDDYSAANKEMSKALEIWSTEEYYTHVFIRHCEIDTICDLFYDALSSINNHEKYESQILLKKLQHRIDTLVKMEKISLGSIF